MEDLSEDWPSQPPSANTSRVSTSKIPRPQSSTRTSRKVLGERSVTPNSFALNSSVAKKSPKRRSLSAGSIAENVMYSTVEVKSQPTSPVKGPQSDVPEWKARLLGDVDSTQQVDLFGPSKMEKLFQRPVTEKEVKSNNLSFLKHLETIPSSPPSPVKYGNEHDRQLDDLDEYDEDIENRSVLHHDNDDDVFADSGVLPSSPDRYERLPVPPKDTRYSSAPSNNDSFSAVYISKHNTADGGIGYAPIDMSRSELAEQLAMLALPQEEDVSEDLPTDLPMGTPSLPSIGEFVTVDRGGYSQQGSFRTRPLSPSPLRNVSFVNSHSSVDTSVHASSESFPILLSVHCCFLPCIDITVPDVNSV
jgi:hypothetical protein